MPGAQRGAPPSATDERLIHPVGGVKSNGEKRIQILWSEFLPLNSHA